MSDKGNLGNDWETEQWWPVKERIRKQRQILAIVAGHKMRRSHLLFAMKTNNKNVDFGLIKLKFLPKYIY